MWPHRRFSQSSSTDTGVNEWKRRRQQTTGSHGWNPAGRTCYSLPARRKTSHLNMRAENSGCKIETQENNASKWGSSVKSQGDTTDERNRFVDLTSQSFHHQRSPLKEITNCYQKPDFQNYSSDKSESNLGSFNPVGFMVERQQSTNLFNFTKQGCYQNFKNFNSDTDSPTPSPNTHFAFSEGNRTFPNASESMRKNLNYFNSCTPAVRNYQSQGDNDGHLRKQIENSPSNLLSPYPLRLREECYSPLESVYEEMTFKKELSDEDDVHSVQTLSPPQFNSFTEDIPFFRPISTSYKNHMMKHPVMSQLQPYTTDPDEE